MPCLIGIDIYGGLLYLIMFNLIAVFFSLFFIGLTGWTAITYLVKKDSQSSIKKEFGNLLNLTKMLLLTLKSLLGVLAKHSFTSDSNDAASVESKELEEQLLKVVEPAQPVEVPLNEDEDTALSSFSPELIEAITEEEEKIA